ncbi:MAG: hypothetical protein E5X66_15125 [Mesorhizobium sp.]|nr:MAG: hypothetical protein E5X66_15125 [Mesorhizobium sp.]
MSELASKLSDQLTHSLVTAHSTGGRVSAPLPDLEALTRVQALRMQSEVAKLQPPIVGWKVAALADGDVISAPIVHRRFARSPAILTPAVYGHGGVECEIAFRFSRQPAAGASGISEAAVFDAIDGACAAIEVVDTRWDLPAPIPRNAMVADLLSNGALVVGSFKNDWQSVSFRDLSAQLTINGHTVSHTKGGHSDGNLISLLTMLANDLLTRGEHLKAGDVVTTGSFTGFHTARPGDVVQALFEGFASVSVTFSPLQDSGENNALW